MATPRSQARATISGDALPHHQRHHRADGAGDARGIGVQLRQRLVATALGVPRQPFEQRLRQLARNRETRDHVGESAIGGQVHRLAAIGAIKPIPQSLDGGGAIAAEIDRIVGQPAERIERDGGIGDLSRQHF